MSKINDQMFTIKSNVTQLTKKNVVERELPFSASNFYAALYSEFFLLRILG
jgi:hypothetical protein